jgi:Smg protein
MLSGKSTVSTGLPEDSMDKIVIALNMVIDYLEFSEKTTEKDIKDYLFNTGFDDHEVRQVLFVLDISNFDGNLWFRVFTKKEQNTLSAEAIAYLQKLHLSGILDPLGLEDVIESAMTGEGYKVDVEAIKNLALYSLMERKSLYASGVEDDEDYLN